MSSRYLIDINSFSPKGMIGWPKCAIHLCERYECDIAYNESSNDYSDQIRYVKNLLKAETNFVSVKNDLELNKYDKYTKTVLNRLLGGLGVTADEYLAASRKMSKFNFEMSKLMKKHNILLTPTVPVKTPKIKDSESPNTPEANLMGKFTGVFNLTGQPSISVPAGLSKDKMPIGLMLSGRMLEDNDVLNVAMDWQKETEFHKLLPDI